MNIWIVHPSAGGPEVGRHWRPYWLADAWNRMGHKATVICANYHHLMQGEQRQPGYNRIGEVDFWFVETLNYRGNGLGRIASTIWFTRKLSSNIDDILNLVGAPDLIIASTPHLFHVGVMRRVARRFNTPFWVEVRDLWPLSIIALGMASPWNPLTKLIGWQERYAYLSADRLISLLLNAESHMQARGLKPNRFRWVPNGVSDSEINTALQESVVEHPVVDHIRDLKKHGKKVIIYAGAMGPPNAIGSILNAAAILARSNPEMHFVLIGSGVSRSQLKRQAIDMANVEFLEAVPRPVVHGALRAADCAVVAFQKNPLYDHGISPNKIFDYCLCAPRTVIACDASALTGLEDLVTTRCAPGDELALVGALIDSLSGSERPLEQRIASIKKFSYTQLATKYLE